MIVIGIAGPSGSGKSTVAEKLKAHYGERALVITEDRYYHDVSDRDNRLEINFDEPQALDHAKLVEDIRALHAGESIRLPQYSYLTGARSFDADHIQQPEILILEGIFVLTCELREQLDVKVFIDVSKDIALVRRLQRDQAERGTSFGETLGMYPAVRQGLLEHIKPCKRHADLVIENHGDKDALEIESIVERTDRLLSPQSLWQRFIQLIMECCKWVAQLACQLVRVIVDVFASLGNQGELPQAAPAIVTP